MNFKGFVWITSRLLILNSLFAGGRKWQTQRSYSGYINLQRSQADRAPREANYGSGAGKDNAVSILMRYDAVLDHNFSARYDLYFGALA